jgi:hypothetical protein
MFFIRELSQDVALLSTPPLKMNERRRTGRALSRGSSKLLLTLQLVSPLNLVYCQLRAYDSRTRIVAHGLKADTSCGFSLANSNGCKLVA